MQELDIRTERLRQAIAEDPQAFAEVLGGIAEAMQETAEDFLREETDRDVIRTYAGDYADAQMLKHINFAEVATYAAY